MRLQVKIFYCDDIPDEYCEEIFHCPKSELEGWELDRGILCIIYDGVLIEYHMDGMEPEDASFGRDLGWIPGAIEKAYAMGKAEA